MFQSKTIADLQAANAALEAEKNQLAKEKAELEKSIEVTNRQLGEAKAAQAGAEGQVTDLQAKLTAAEAAKASAEQAAAAAVASVDTEVTARLAAAGVDPVKRDPSAAEASGDPKPDTAKGETPRTRLRNAVGSWSIFGKK